MDDQAVAKKKYEAYKTKVMAGDITIDWRDFRLTAALGEVSEGFDPQPVHNQVVDDLAAGRYEKALAATLWAVTLSNRGFVRCSCGTL